MSICCTSNIIRKVIHIFQFAPHILLKNLSQEKLGKVRHSVYMLCTYMLQKGMFDKVHTRNSTYLTLILSDSNWERSFSRDWRKNQFLLNRYSISTISDAYPPVSDIRSLLSVLRLRMNLFLILHLTNCAGKLFPRERKEVWTWCS